MSETSGEKTEPPSPKKIRDARAKGQVAKSQEVVTTVSLAAVVATIWFTWTGVIAIWREMFDQIATMTGGDFRVNAGNAFAIAFRQSSLILLPILGAAILAGIAAN